MKENKKYSSHHSEFISTNHKKNSKKTKKVKKHVPKFLKWLKKRIESGNRKFALDSQELIITKPSHANPNILFILPEVLEQYDNYSGISAKLMQLELKKKLMITFDYTIVRNKSIIEVFPINFLDLNSV
ncbi:Uncharacterised protein [Legionella beliardensis]|uniref:Uncharacterized protein n=1 Tax=Legionella beliardensis TaxID=91822 RepID=A0A378HX86_9GAMM|nr:hypothetical protein [Legionella beliardensis]STX27528.1 Uncharacterised protein [Legionella beliardensis]